MLVYSYYPEATGGAERQCRLQAHELARRGHSCTILTARSSFGLPRREWESGCAVVRVTVAQAWVDLLLRVRPSAAKKGEGSAPANSALPSDEPSMAWPSHVVRWLNALFFMVGATRFLLTHRRDFAVLHTHIADWNAGFVGWIGHRLGLPVLAKAAFFPAFPRIHGVPLASRWRHWRKRIAYIAMTEVMADDLVAEGVPREQLRVIPNGVPEAPVVAVPADSETVLYVGNFTQGAAHKAFDVLLDAWALVAPRCPNARLQIAGGGDAESWQAYARKLGCADRVDFLGHQRDLEPCYLRAGLLVLPSRGEGISNALLEAMSFGLPVVVSDIPGNRTVVRDGVDGLVVPTGDAASLAEALHRLLGSPDLRQSMGRAARARVRAAFDLGRVVDAVTDYYANLATGPATSGRA
jgi:glycosyltransferase involved in cell wall biosynthesis